MKEILQEIFEFIEQIWGITQFRLFSLSGTDFTFGDVIYFIFSLALIIYVAGWIKNLLVNKILSRYQLDIGIRQSIGTIIRYIILIIGFFIVIQTAGIDLSALGLLAGALGVGIGFGLQNVTNNFISGIIILFERPIKVGDRIEVGEISGDVVRISSRATSIITNDNISVIVPNSDFINSTVINWSHNDRMVRFNFPVGVSYKEDPERIRRVLLAVVGANKGVLKNPVSDVLFESYGDNSINFILRVWTSDYINRPNVLKSQLYYEVFKSFREENIEIPFPQRDLHLKSGFDGKNIPIDPV